MSYSTAANVREHLWPEQALAPSWFGGVQKSLKKQPEWIRIKSIQHSVCGIEVPNSLSYLVQSVEKSKWILELEDDWDEAGSIAYSQATWDQSVRFIVKTALEVWESTSRRIPTPQIQNGPTGSIDIFWETDNFTLLINIPPNGREANYYGSKIRGSELIGGEIKGTLDLKSPARWLMTWAME